MDSHFPRYSSSSQLARHRRNFAAVLGLILAACLLLFRSLPVFMWYQPGYDERAEAVSDLTLGVNPVPARLLEQAERSRYSPGGEDGVLVHIFGRLGTHEKQYVEFNAGDGSACLTRMLREDLGWKGLALDPVNPSDARINLQHAAVTKSNACSLFEKYDVPQQLDLLVIRTHMHDFWILRELIGCHFSPRVLVVEINANLGPSASLTVPMSLPNDQAPDITNFYGASLMAYARLLRGKYMLVYVERNGVHAFFVRLNSLQGFFVAPKDFTPWVESKWRYPRATWFGPYVVDVKRRAFQEV